MKNVKLFFAAFFMFAMFSVTAQAQQDSRVGQAVAGLVNVTVGAIQVDVELDNVLNNFTLVDVDNVLNNNDIDILNNILNRSPILSNNRDFLNNLLREADIITENQIVVGVLSSGFILIDDIN